MIDKYCLQSIGHSASHHGRGSAGAAPQVLFQTPYHNGPVPADDRLVTFDVSMPAAENGQVKDGSRCAFSGELAVLEKVSFRFGVRRELHLQTESPGVATDLNA